MTATSSRMGQSARNAGVSVLTQVVTIVLGFAVRTVFIAELGIAMVGVNALLTSTVALLALADLGINGALMYTLYKPLREGDIHKAAAIVRYAGRLFRWVALAVAVIGLALTPFIHQLIKLEEGIEQIEIYYLVFVANIVVGYLMLNRLVLLEADQKIYLTKTYSLIFNVLRSIAQIVSLIAFGSFLAFLLIQVFFTVANNVTIYHRAGRLYPHIRVASIALTDNERRSILRSTRAMMIYRVGGLVLNNSTALLISVIVGTVALGFYSNYMLVVGAAIMVIEVAFSALTPSVGNLVAAGDRVAGRRVFDELVLLAILIHGLIAVGFLTLINDFMELWLGTAYVLPLDVVFVIVLNFYVVGTLMPLWSFRSATGLFRQTQQIMLLTAAISIVLAFALGSAFGLAGVAAAPVVARLVSGAWYEPWILVRDHLSGRAHPYFGLQAGAFLLWSGVALSVTAVGSLAPTDPLTSMITKAVFLAASFPAVSWLVFGRTKAFQSLTARMRTPFRALRNRS